MSVVTPTLPRLFALAAILSLAPVAVAETHRHEPSRLQIDIPDDWTIEFDEESQVLTAKSPDEAVALQFVLLDADDLEAALEALRTEVEKKVSELEIGEFEKVEVNGLEGQAADGRGKVDDTAVEMAIALIVSPTGKVLLSVGIAASDSFPEHRETVLGIYRSLRPIEAAGEGEPQVEDEEG